MPEKNRINFGRLKFMYLYTIIGAGGFGLGILLIPNTMISLFRWPDQDPVVFGITGSVYLAFAIVSLFGLRSPLKFSPILLLQLFYKSIWSIGVVPYKFRKISNVSNINFSNFCNICYWRFGFYTI